MKQLVALTVFIFQISIGLGQILKKPIPDKLVVLTFDDAVSTHATFVAPLLRKYEFGATFFVCEFPPDFHDKSKYLTWKQIKQLHDWGFEIGNHTATHKHVNQMDKNQIEAELHYIESKCSDYQIKAPETFAYPAYQTSNQALEVLEEKGYLFARIGGSRPYIPTKDHPFLIPSYSTTGNNYDGVIDAIKHANSGKIVVLTLHGVPDYAHDWVTTPPLLFEKYLQYLADHEYQVIALKDLENYIQVPEAKRSITPKLGAQYGQSVKSTEQLDATETKISYEESAIPILATGSQSTMPSEWIDMDTGHRIKKLGPTGQSNRSFYFHNNPFLKASDGYTDLMVFYGTKADQPKQLYSLNT